MPTGGQRSEHGWLSTKRGTLTRSVCARAASTATAPTASSQPSGWERAVAGGPHRCVHRGPLPWPHVRALTRTGPSAADAAHSLGRPAAHAYSSWQPGAWCQLASSLSSEACHSWLLASTATLDRALVRAAASSSDRLSAATTSVSLFARHDQNLPAAGRGTLLPSIYLYSHDSTITIRDYLGPGSFDPDFGHLYINHFDRL